MTNKSIICLVALIPGQQSPFRRNVRDGKGNVVKKLVFESDSPIEIETQEELDTVIGDIGSVLCYVNPADENGQYSVNWDKTWAEREKRTGEAKPKDAKSKRTKINAGLGAKRPKVVEAGSSDKPQDSDDDGVKLSDQLTKVLEANLAAFGATEFGQLPELLEQKYLDGFDFGTVADMEPGLINELLSVLAASRNTDLIVAAGIPEDIAAKLARNVKSRDDLWLLAPDGIKLKLAAGFDLASLAEIGPAMAKKIKAALSK